MIIRKILIETKKKVDSQQPLSIVQQTISFGGVSDPSSSVVMIGVPAVTRLLF